MGGPAEERTRGEGAEASGEAGQRGETDSGRIETKRNISSFIYGVFIKIMQNFKFPTPLKMLNFLQTSMLFVYFCSLTERHKQFSCSLTKIHSKRTPSAPTTKTYLLLCVNTL